MKSNLEQKKKRNREQRKKFVAEWVEFIKSHPDKEWSRQQNIIVNSQLESAQESNDK